MPKVKVTRVGSSTGVVRPKDVLARLKVDRGDVLYVTETARGIERSPYDPGFEEEMDAARKVMRRYRNALRQLAK